MYEPISSMRRNPKRSIDKNDDDLGMNDRTASILSRGGAELMNGE